MGQFYKVDRFDYDPKTGKSMKQNYPSIQSEFPCTLTFQMHDPLELMEPVLGVNSQ